MDCHENVLAICRDRRTQPATPFFMTGHDFGFGRPKGEREGKAT